MKEHLDIRRVKKRISVECIGISSKTGVLMKKGAGRACNKSEVDSK